MRRIELLILSGFGENALTPNRVALYESGSMTYPDKAELEALKEEVFDLTPVKAFFTVEHNHVYTTLAWDVPEDQDSLKEEFDAASI